VGLLQKLLGRRTEGSTDTSAGAEAAEPTSAAPEQPAATDPQPDDEETTTVPETSSVLSDAAPLPAAGQRTELSAMEEPHGSAEPAGEGSPPETEPDAAPGGRAAGKTAGVPPVDMSIRPPVTEIFVPERPRRELLDLEPPPPPPEESRQQPTSLPLDVSGSPRAALRNAGITVPHMHQIVQRGDVRMWAFAVRAEEALGWWLQVRQVHDKTGWLPVLLGAADDWLDNGESVLHEGDDELGRMAELDATDLLHDKAAEAGEPPRGVPILPTRGDSDFAVPKTDGLLGLVEAEHSWQIPALLPWKGSTNWELYGAEHATVLRHWHHQHEVELVSMTWDILELYVPNPPRAEADVLAAAHEANAYCPDLLAAGVPTLDDLAVHMIRSRAWYFRWK
jgi:hypothetical protein